VGRDGLTISPPVLAQATEVTSSRPCSRDTAEPNPRAVSMRAESRRLVGTHGNFPSNYAYELGMALRPGAPPRSVRLPVGSSLTNAIMKT
jgi:hypothetical protein